jgi:protein ImuA
MNTLQRRADRHACLAELRRRIGAIERGAFGVRSAATLKETGSDRREQGLFSPFMASFDADTADQTSIDQALAADAMARPALHELVADGYGHQPAVREVGLALAASLLRRQSAGARSMVLWCQRQKDELEFGRLYGPGLSGLGLAPDQLVIVTGRRDSDCLWAMEQGLSSGSLAAVIGAVDRVGLIASRRLSLAASAHRTWCLLLPARHGREPSAAATRWRVRTESSQSDERDRKLLGRARWQLTLERNRHGRTGHWIAEWDHAAYRFHLVDPMGNRPAAVAAQNGRDEVAGRNGGDKEVPAVLAFGRTG